MFSGCHPTTSYTAVPSSSPSALLECRDCPVIAQNLSAVQVDWGGQSRLAMTRGKQVLRRRKRRPGFFAAAALNDTKKKPRGIDTRGEHFPASLRAEPEPWCHSQRSPSSLCHSERSLRSEESRSLRSTQSRFVRARFAA